MSYESFKEALELVKQCKGYKRGKKIPKEYLDEAEEMLSIRFSKQNREYYEEYGYIAFGKYRLYGVLPNIEEPTDETIQRDAIVFTLQCRDDYIFPEGFVPILDLSENKTDYYFELAERPIIYFDYSQKNAEGEPIIVKSMDDYEDFSYEKVAEDFGDFLLGIVKETLKIK